jgi:membrane protein implicated in regulation of membrane protease activity
MKSSILLAAVLFVLSIVFGLIQIWVTPWSAEIFAKIELTLGAFLVMDIVLIYVIKEYRAYKSISQADQFD